ncbi:hypothetical protein [Streptomyces sp. NPDC059166]|uniref:hypothetical protein n=1 Tax=Streptomyces sp. NPDC059166 TaxID=3346752 RepID=UPI003694A915
MSESGDSQGPDARRLGPAGAVDTTVEALGALSEALETVERARGQLYGFHQLTGGADLALDRAVELLRMAGHAEQADLVEREIVGRNVVPGRWTFQLVEEYEDTYYRPFAEVEERLRRELAGGRRHLYEAAMKEARRTHGHPQHTARP